MFYLDGYNLPNDNKYFHETFYLINILMKKKQNRSLDCHNDTMQKILILMFVTRVGNHIDRALNTVYSVVQVGERCHCQPLILFHYKSCICKLFIIILANRKPSLSVITGENLLDRICQYCIFYGCFLCLS